MEKAKKVELTDHDVLFAKLSLEIERLQIEKGQAGAQ